MKQEKIDKLIRVITGIYLVLLLAGLPLICDGTYMRIGTIKWEFFRTITLGCRVHGILVPGLLFLLFLLFVWFDDNKRGLVRIAGWWGIVYSADVCISTLFAADRAVALNGFPGWYLGLYTQISLILIYYLISRKPVPLRPVYVLTGIVSSFIFLLEVLNRFYLYPFPVLDFLEEDQIKLMVSTIGNINWFAGYMVCMIPLCYTAFLHSAGKEHLLSGIWVLITAVSLATQNSESAAVSFFAVIMLLLFLYRNQPAQLCRVLRLILLTAAGWLVIGFIYRGYPGDTVPMDKICSLMMRPDIDLVLIGIALLGDFLLQRRMTNPKPYHLSASVCIIAGLILTAGLLVLLRSFDSAYFRFNDYWGNYRGMIWRITWESWMRIWRESPLKALFGCGPDQFYLEVTGHYSELLNEVYHGQILTNAHNEILTSLIHSGLFGTVAYYGIFVHSIRSFIRNRGAKPELTAGLLCSVSYLVNNFFSFQQIISTPILFGLLAVFLSHTQNDAEEKI